jgi:hypothetical protein
MEFMRLKKFRSAGRLSVLPGAAKFSTQHEGAFPATGPVRRGVQTSRVPQIAEQPAMRRAGTELPVDDG